MSNKSDERLRRLEESRLRVANAIGLQRWSAPVEDEDSDSDDVENRFFRIKVGWLFVYFDIEGNKPFAFHILNQVSGQPVTFNSKLLAVVQGPYDSSKLYDVIDHTIFILNCQTYHMSREQFDAALDFVRNAATNKLTQDMFDEFLAVVGDDDKATSI